MAKIYQYKMVKCYFGTLYLLPGMHHQNVWLINYIGSKLLNQTDNFFINTDKYEYKGHNIR
jgi:hypothetical protein